MAKLMLKLSSDCSGIKRRKIFSPFQILDQEGCTTSLEYSLSQNISQKGNFSKMRVGGNFGYWTT